MSKKIVFKPVSLIVLFFLSTVALLLLSNKIERLYPDYRSFVAALVAILLGSFFYALSKKLFQRLGIQYKSPEFIDLSFGILIGFIVFLLASSALYLSGHSFDFETFEIETVLKQLGFQLRPAIIEEIGFRFGIVGISLYFFNKRVVLLLGSIPFGFLHLLNFLSGGSIYWEYIIGTTAAGFFLTSVYFSFGLAGAKGAHFVWNVFASIASNSSSFKQQKLEGGLWTYLVLATVSAILLERTLQKNQC